MGNKCGCGKKHRAEGHADIAVEGTHPLSQKINAPSELSQVLKDPLNSDKIVVADFYAPWCGPCQKIAPQVEKFAEEFAANAVFVKVNVDDNDELAMSYGVSSMPTFIIFKDGEKIDEVTGANVEKLRQLIVHHINKT